MAVRCSTDECSGAAAFYVFRPPTRTWRPLCAEHLRDLHPSLERTAWLESGYARPVELGEPDEPPPVPPTDRAGAFREIVDGAMGWSE